jgi:hypothetical protein
MDMLEKIRIAKVRAAEEVVVNDLQESGIIANPEPTVSAWIKELEENAEEKQMCDGYLIDEQEYCDENKVDFCPSMDGEQWVDLHGQFTIQQLQDLINHMKRYQNG